MHLRAARTNGVTVEEIKELLMQTAIYCGVPDANTAFRIAQQVLEEGSLTGGRQPAGTPPLEARTTRWVGSTRAGVSWTPQRRLVRQRLDGPRAGLLGPLGERGQRRVAEVGAEDVVEADHADVAGHRDSALRPAARITPMASMSLWADHRRGARREDGVGGGRAAAHRRACRARSAGRSRPRASAAACSPGQRRAPDQDSAGPPRNTNDRCPSDARWSTICRVPES